MDLYTIATTGATAIHIGSTNNSPISHAAVDALMSLQATPDAADECIGITEIACNSDHETETSCDGRLNVGESDIEPMESLSDFWNTEMAFCDAHTACETNYADHSENDVTMHDFSKATATPSTGSAGEVVAGIDALIVAPVAASAPATCGDGARTAALSAVTEDNDDSTNFWMDKQLQWMPVRHGYVVTSRFPMLVIQVEQKNYDPCWVKFLHAHKDRWHVQTSWENGPKNYNNRRVDKWMLIARRVACPLGEQQSIITRAVVQNVTQPINIRAAVQNVRKRKHKRNHKTSRASSSVVPALSADLTAFQNRHRDSTDMRPGDLLQKCDRAWPIELAYFIAWAKTELLQDRLRQVRASY